MSFLPYPGLEALVDAYTLQGPGRHGLAFSSPNRFLPTSIVPPHTLLYTGKVPIHTQASFLPAQGRDQPGADSWCAEPLPWSGDTVAAQTSSPAPRVVRSLYAQRGGAAVKKYSLTVGILVVVLAVGGMANADDEGLKFRATLSGAQEVPEVVTDTTGSIRVEFNKALSEAEFRLVVRDGKQVRVAHFHCQRPGLNGPVVIDLFTGPVTDVDGELAQGTLTNAGFLPAGEATCPGLIERPVNNIAALAFAMRDGLIYANVHTAANTGGEIRGQLIEVSEDKDVDHEDTH